jgi:hypothetical protein
MYRDMSYMKYQFFIYTEWKGGGIYASPSFPGTRPGGPIAAAWATLKKLGEDGYLELTKKILETREYFLSELAKMPDLKLLAYPDSTLVSFISVNSKIGIYAVADQLQAKGWNVTRQQNPESLHLSLSPSHADFIQEFVSDLKEAVETVRANPSLNTTGQAAMYGMMAKIPFRGMIKGSVLSIMEKMYGANNQDIDEKSDEVNNWGDFVEKVGANALEVKRQVDEAWDKLKGSFTKN